jgi:hypothetical protein
LYRHAPVRIDRAGDHDLFEELKKVQRFIEHIVGPKRLRKRVLRVILVSFYKSDLVSIAVCIYVSDDGPGSFFVACLVEGVYNCR